MPLVVINRVIPGCFEITTDSRSHGRMDGVQLIEFLRDELGLCIDDIEAEEHINKIQDKIDKGFTVLNETMTKEVIESVRRIVMALEDKVGV